MDSVLNTISTLHHTAITGCLSAHIMRHISRYYQSLWPGEIKQPTRTYESKERVRPCFSHSVPSGILARPKCVPQGSLLSPTDLHAEETRMTNLELTTSCVDLYRKRANGDHGTLVNPEHGCTRSRYPRWISNSPVMRNTPKAESLDCGADKVTN